MFSARGPRGVGPRTDRSPYARFSRSRRRWLGGLLLVIACGSEAPAASGQRVEPDPSSLEAPYAELAGLDRRAPVPLRPKMAWDQKQKMMTFLVAIERVSEALAGDDWEAVGRASAVLGTSPQTRSRCGRVDAASDAITTMAIDFRCRADAIGAAARAEDRAAVLRAMADTVQACNGCHAAFRQDVVDARAWRALPGHPHVPSQ